MSCVPSLPRIAFRRAHTGSSWRFKNGYCKVTTSTKKLKPVLWVQDAAGNVLSAVPATK